MSADRVVVDGAEGPELDLVVADGSAHAVIWPGMGAQLRSMARISLAAGGRTRLLRHPGEAVYYVIEGAGIVIDPGECTETELVEGSMVHVEGDTAYELRAADPGMELVGGPAPADPALYGTEAG